jgi:type II secretory pathway pseudopilin PulG
LVVIAIVAVLAVTVILTLNPADLLKQARDSNRLSDLNTINKALAIFQADVSGGSLGTANKVYVSVPDTSSTCVNLSLPTLPSGYTYGCAPTSTLRNVDGTGWLPVNFSSMPSGSPLPGLPIDSINSTSTGLYYTYVMGTSGYELTAFPESSKYKMGGGSDIASTDGGQYTELIEKGNNLSLQPVTRDPSLVGYWPFNEGSGATAYDASGKGNDLTWGGGSSYATGKVGSYSANLTGSNSASKATPNSALTLTGSFSISHWFNTATAPASGWQGMVFKYTGAYPASVATYSNNSTGAVAGIINLANQTPSYTPTFGTWYYLTYVRDANALQHRLYINGQLIGQSASVQPAAGTGAIYIAGQNISYQGKIDEVRIYNRALSAAEVQAIYSATQ